MGCILSLCKICLCDDEVEQQNQNNEIFGERDEPVISAPSSNFEDYKRDIINTNLNFINQQFTLEEVPNNIYKKEYWEPVTIGNINTLKIVDNLIFPNWNHIKITDNYKLIYLPLGSDEAQLVINKFHDSSPIKYKINKIARIENHYLYAMYLLKKEEMKCRNWHVDEIILFHGTKRKNINSICNDNFDWRRCGDAIGHRFGQGVSFTPKPTYAIHYCDKGPRKTIFLVNVLVSKAVEGHSDMVIPYNSFNGKIQFYDTSVKPNIDVIVKFCDNEFYPHYIIEFFDTKFSNNRNVRY